MGRELKRVSLDFAWPLKKVWAGYLNPYAAFQIDCTECECLKARCDREDVPVECPKCKGEDLWASDGARQLYEAWRCIDPPSGPGFQLWETTSKGSPISPVFETLDALCTYAATNCSTFADALVSAEKWREILDAGFVHHTEKVGNTTILFI